MKRYNFLKRGYKIAVLIVMLIALFNINVNAATKTTTSTKSGIKTVIKDTTNKAGIRTDYVETQYYKNGKVKSHKDYDYYSDGAVKSAVWKFYDSNGILRQADYQNRNEWQELTSRTIAFYNEKGQLKKGSYPGQKRWYSYYYGSLIQTKIQYYDKNGKASNVKYIKRTAPSNKTVTWKATNYDYNDHGYFYVSNKAIDFNSYGPNKNFQMPMTYKSSNPNVIKVDGEWGNMKIVGYGTTTITAYRPSYETKKITIQVGINPTVESKNIIKLMNDERKKQGKPALKENAELNKAALIRAKELPKKFDHIRPDGTQWWTVEKQVNYPGDIAGENAAYTGNYRSYGKDFYQMWFDSPGHYDNMFNEPMYTDIGVAIYLENQYTYAIQIFGVN